MSKLVDFRVSAHLDTKAFSDHCFGVGLSVLRSAHVLFWWSGIKFGNFRWHHGSSSKSPLFLKLESPKVRRINDFALPHKMASEQKNHLTVSSLADKQKRAGMISSKPCPPQDWQKYYASDHTWPSGLVGDCWLFRGSKGLDTRLRGAWRAMPCQPMLPTTTSLQVHVEIKSHLDHFSSHSLIKIPMKFNASIMHYDEKWIAYLTYQKIDFLRR